MLEAIALLTIAGLFALLAAVRFSWAVALTLVLLPSYLLRFSIGFVPMTVLEVLLLIVILVFVIRFFRQPQQPFLFPFRLPVLLFLLSGAVSVIIAPDIRQALGLYKAYFLEPALFFLILANTIKSRREVTLVLVSLGLGVVGIGFVAVLQQLDFLPIAAHYGLESPPRATAVFPFPTAVGKFVGPLLALFAALWLVRPHQDISGEGAKAARSRRFFIGVFVFGLLALVLSVSRGALIGVAAATFVVSFFSRHRRVILTVLLGLALLCFAVPQLRENVASVVRGADTSTDVHLIMWQGAVRIIEAYPITGTGLASFPIVYERFRDAAHVELFPNPDQLFLTLWIETGLAGLLAFIVLLGSAVAAAWRGLTTDRPLAVGLLAAFIALVVHGLVDTPYFKNDLAVVFWTLLALADAVARPKAALEQRP